MSTYLTTDSELTSVADAIRNKSGISVSLAYPTEFISTISGISPSLQSKGVTITPSTSSQSQTVSANSGYDGLSQVTVTVPAITAGTAGTPVAAKGAVNNNSVIVTPTVTNTTGYITGDTKTGTALTISAGELVSGTLSITSNNTYDVTNYASATVSISAGAPTYKVGVIRPDAELVQAWTYDKNIHADEGVTIPTYTTTAQVLKATATLATPTITPTTKNYFIVERFLAIPTYNISTIAKGRFEWWAGSNIYEIGIIEANTVHALINPSTYHTTRSSAILSTTTVNKGIYWISTSAINMYNASAYGTYMVVVPPTISGTTLTINSPTFYVRGSTTYLTNTYMNAITDIRYQYRIELWSATKGAANLDGWGAIQNLMQAYAAIDTTNHTLT